MRRPMLLAGLMALALGGGPDEAPARDFSQRVRAALGAENRTPDERARDANRKPAETLAFLGLREDMDVLELIPGGAWYTKVLAPALQNPRQLSVWIAFERFADRLAQPGLEGVRVVARDTELEATSRRGIYELSDAPELGKERFDVALTFRNLHNLTPATRARLHRAVFEALRPGGIYGVVDHTRRHMEPDTPENRRRLDPVVAMEEILAAGFAFEAWSDLHRRPGDDLRLEVGHPDVTGATDRFTFRFRKPEAPPPDEETP